MQINLHHCQDANNALFNYCTDNSIDIILAQDPYVKNGVLSGIPSDWPYFLSINNNAAIISTNKDLALISNLALSNSVFVSLNVYNGVIFFGSQYSSPSGNLDEDMEAHAAHFNDYDRILIGGDFNVPMLDFGYTRQNDRTEILLEHLANTQLSILNDPGAPHSFIQGPLKGRPDLTLGGNEIKAHLDGWFVDVDRYSFSDHRYIRYNLSYQPLIRTNYRYKTKNKSFKKFNQKISEHMPAWKLGLIRVNDAKDLDEFVSNFTEDLTNIANSCFKKGKLSHKPTIRWYDNDLKILRNKISALYKRMTKNPDNDRYREDYVRGRNDYKKKIKKAKKLAWYNYCENTNDCYGNLYKFVSNKALKFSDMIFTRLEDSAPFDSYDDVANRLMIEHFAVDELPDEIYEYISTITDDTASFTDRISNRELKHVIKQQPNGKAPGFDNFDTLMVKSFCKNNLDFVRNLYDKCLRIGHFPATWKKGSVIFFRKRNKVATSPRAYRPITLLPIFGKLLERIIKLRVMTLLESTGYLDNHQFGFREKRSTLTALNELKKIVKNLLSGYKYCAMTSIDIQGAFDSVSWQMLATLIDQLPIPQYLKRILKNYISNRKIGFKYVAGIIWYELFKGCPQGSCIGPLLWLIVADFILKHYKLRNYSIISYADDFVVLEGADNRRKLEENMNSAVEWFNNAIMDLQMNISTEKCISMLFGRFNLEKRRPLFKLQGKSIPVKDNIKYLGFILDGKFSWIDHFEAIRENIRSMASGIKKTTTRNRGLNTSYRKIWYNAVIEKQITYGHEIWTGDLKSQALRKLSSCQRIGLLTILHTYRSVSTEALCVMSGVPPLHIKLKYNAQKYNVIHGNSSIMVNDVRISSVNIMRQLCSFDFPSYYKLTNLNITENSTIVMDPDSNCPLIFTDGSKIADNVGAAYTVWMYGDFVRDFRVKLNGQNSVYQAELIGIKYATLWFISSSFRQAKIYTDSLSSLHVLNNAFPSNCIVRDIFLMLQQSANKFLEISWTKAHIGTLGNERADCLAKSVIIEDNYDIYEDLQYPISVINRYNKMKIVQDWQNDWKRSEKGRDTYMILNKVNTEFLVCNYVVQFFVSGHGSFPTFLHKIGKRRSNKCDCGDLGNVTHYIFSRCPFMPYFFNFDKSRTLRENLRAVLFNPVNHQKLTENYNVLNSLYSFIKYKL